MQVEVEHVDGLVAQPRPIWPFALGLSLLLGASGVGWALWPRTPLPYRIAVTAHGCEAECLDRFEREVERTLSSSLDVIRLDGERGRPEDPAAAIERARERRALTSVWLELEPIEERPASGLEPAYVRARGRATVRSTTEAEEASSHTVEVAAHGSRLAAARREVARRLGSALATAALRAALDREPVRGFAASADIEVDEMNRQTQVQRQVARLEPAQRAQQLHAESCAEATDALAADEGDAAVTCLSGGCAEDYAFAISPGGEAALVHVESPGIEVSLDSWPTVQRVETVERIDWVPLDGSEPRVLGTADNYYSYPGVSGDGRLVAVIEEWPYAFGLVLLNVADGARTPLRHFDVGLPQSPRLSHGGSWILLRTRLTRRSPARLVVMEARPGARPRQLGRARIGSWVRVALESGQEPVDLVAELVDRAELPRTSASRPGAADPEAEEPDQAEEPDPSEDAAQAEVYDDRLALFDPSFRSVARWLDDDEHEIDRVGGAHQGRVLFTWDGGCGAGWWSPSTGERHFVRTRHCLRDARATARGTLIGEARATTPGDPRPSDSELIEVDPTDGTERILTANALRERYPRPAAQGRRVVFDRFGERAQRQLPRVGTCWLELPSGG